MDEVDGGGYGGGDRNQVISAVADENFMGEEDDDDYEDLYNDVNVGEGFHQSLHPKIEDSRFNNKQQPEVKTEPPVTDSSYSTKVEIPGIVPAARAGAGPTQQNLGSGAAPPPSYQNLGFRENNAGPVPSTVGMRVSLGQNQASVAPVKMEVDNNQMVQHGMPLQASVPVQQQQPHGGMGMMNVGPPGNDVYGRQGGPMGNAVNGGNMNVVGGGGVSGGTLLFVGELHWWTTDAELEAELCKYGSVKEVKFYDEKASGKSKGYCQVEFFDFAAAAACKDGMNGYPFNGRPCVVAFASPQTVKRMGEAQMNKNQNMAQNQGAVVPGRRGVADAGPGRGSIISTGGNYQGIEGNRGFGRGNWGRGNGAQGRGQVGQIRNRMGGMGGRGIIGNGANGFAPGMQAGPPMMHPQAMMGQGFDPSFGAHMGRMGGYGGFPGGPAPPFGGILSPFPQVGNVGLPGVSPHVNPAFFRGMPGGGMGMMPTAGPEGPGMGMWQDPSMAAWGGEEPVGRVGGDSSYGEDAASDQYGEAASHERAAWPNSMKEKERAPERDWSGPPPDRRYRDEREPPAPEREMPREKDVGHDHDWPERRHRDDRDMGRERDRDRERDRERERERERDSRGDRYREEKDRYVDHHRYRERDLEHESDWDRGRVSSSHSKSRISHEEHRRSRSRDADYGKRRRLPSE